MKILIFSGTHSRHLYIHKALLDLGVDYFAIVMDREDVLPTPPSGLGERDKTNFIRHFNDRYDIEERIYGNIKVSDVFNLNKMIRVRPGELNSYKVVSEIKKFGAEMAFIFGCDLIKDPVLSCLPEVRVNLHLGLSPWYKGGATLFWPFYFLMPQFAGVTLHQIVEKADAGAIFHQSVPELNFGDGIHDVGAKAVIQARQDVVNMINKYYNQGKRLDFTAQHTSGRVWIGKDFMPAHLRVIYDTYDNNIVDEYLSGNISKDLPNLVRGL